MAYKFNVTPHEKALDRQINKSLKKNAANRGNVKAHLEGSNRIRRLIDTAKDMHKKQS